MVIIGFKTGECVNCGTTAENLAPGFLEDVVQTSDKLFFAHFGNKCLYIMWHIESVVPCISFLKSSPRFFCLLHIVIIFG